METADLRKPKRKQQSGMGTPQPVAKEKSGDELIKAIEDKMGNLKIKINKPKLVKMINKYKIENQFDLHHPLPTLRGKYG